MQSIRKYKEDRMARKAATKIKEEEIEDVVVPKRYYVKFWKIIEPSDRRFDLEVGTIYWSDVKQDIVIEALHGKYSAQIENLLGSDIITEYQMIISRPDTPKEWAQNLHKAIFPNGFYATKFMEIFDETE